ncbi:MAG: hypothetical protein ACJA0V_002648, partial [Planctomycetota bacterium]
GVVVEAGSDDNGRFGHASRVTIRERRVESNVDLVECPASRLLV